MKPDDLELLLKYLHGELDSAAVVAVARRLLNEPDLSAQYVTLAADEATLMEWAASMPSEMAADQLRIDTAAAIAGKLHAPPSGTSSAPHPQQPAVKFSLWQHSRRLGWAAALLITIICGTVWMAAAKSRGPAWLTAAENCQWKNQTAAVGKPLPINQELELTVGCATVEFRCGATAVITAPASFTIVDERTAMLRSGRITAESTAEAKFSIVTPALKVLDLGTRFGVLVESDGAAQVHVFEGEVEAVPLAAPVEKVPAPQPQLLATIQAAQFDSTGKMVDWLSPDYEGFAAARLAPGVRSTSDKVRWVPKAPPSLEQAQFMHSGQVCLILERQNVVLPTDVQVTFTPPWGGTRSGYKTHWGMIPKGTKVDSYLLHFDANPEADLEGAVEFDRPILGIIARGNQLFKTDGFLGAPGVRYEQTNPDRRGLEGGEIAGEHLDVLNLSRPNSVGVWLGEQQGTLDEIRILVLSAP